MSNKKEAIHEKVEFTDVRSLIEWAGEKYSDRIAYSYRTSPSAKEVIKVTFPKLRDDVRSLATEMISMGCTGKHCVIIAKLSYQWAVTYFSALCAGAVLVPLDRDWPAEDLADTVKKANTEFLFCDEDQQDKVPTITQVIELSAPVIYLNAESQENKLDSLIASGREKFAQSHEAYYNTEIDPYALALLVFTSGTTGKGKGVMLSQNAILSDLSDIIPYIDFSHKTVGVLPPHHTSGSSVMFIGHAMIGGEVYISNGIRYVQKELKEQKPGHMVLVPLYLETFYRRILANVRDQGKEEFLNKMIKVSNGLRKVGIDMRKKFFAPIREAFGGE
nr:AMP-binding protein [Clostridia bacterium]